MNFASAGDDVVVVLELGCCNNGVHVHTAAHTGKPVQCLEAVACDAA